MPGLILSLFLLFILVDFMCVVSDPMDEERGRNHFLFSMSCFPERMNEGSEWEGKRSMTDKGKEMA